jgi:hypothetical protein
MDDYKKEHRRMEQIQGQLSVALTLMDPAWSGLAIHPDREGLNDRLNDLRSAIAEAQQQAGFLVYDLGREDTDE